ncbi:Rha family transcriptional regulator [Rhodoferax sp.]|uniref:Rha family transcriptional regulator n=1 Tax=Rhodoferax sp. TaxID=50421 RepID=UPI00374CF1B0
MTSKKTKAPAVRAAGAIKTSQLHLQSSAASSGSQLALTIVGVEARVDSRLLAQQLGTQHESTFKLVKDYQADFEGEGLGKVRFEIGASSKGKTGQKERFAMLTEDQAYLLLTYSRNTARVRQLKVRLVKAFGEARRAAIQHGAEYLPSYHLLHDEIHALAAGSPNERFMHMNANKAVNQAVGIAAGQRGAVAMPTQSLLCVAQMVAAKAVHGAADRHHIQPGIKTALLALSAATQIGGAA